MGPCSQMRRQLALVRWTRSSRPSSARRRFRYSQDSRPASFEQHLGVVWSQQRKIWRRRPGTCRPAASERRRSESAISIFQIDGLVIAVEFKRGGALLLGAEAGILGARSEERRGGK